MHSQQWDRDKLWIWTRLWSGNVSCGYIDKKVITATMGSWRWWVSKFSIITLTIITWRLCSRIGFDVKKNFFFLNFIKDFLYMGALVMYNSQTLISIMLFRAFTAKVPLRLTVSQYQAPSGAHDQITLWQLRSCFRGAPSLTRGRVCLLYMLMVLASTVFLGFESHGTPDHILLSHIWVLPFRRLLRLARSQWKYSTPPPHGY
jgi:hypothetical protein